MKSLLIDDLRVFRDQFTPEDLDVARTSSEAIKLLDINQYDNIFWDHDLGGDDTSMTVASWLLQKGVSGDRYAVETCYIHTANPVGAINLKNTLESRFLNYKCVRLDASKVFRAE